MNNLNNNANYASVENAAASIKSGDTIWIGNSTNFYNEFLEALMKRQDELKDVTILLNKGQTSGKIYDELKNESTFHVIYFFKEALVQTFKNDKISFLKSTSGSAVAMICKEFGVNTMVAEVCPPDEQGYCNVGKAGVYITSMINKQAGITNRIALIDEDLPLASGSKDETAIALSSFDYICIDERVEGNASEVITLGKELVG